MSHVRFKLDLIDERRSPTEGGLLQTTLHTHDLHRDYVADVSNVASLYALAHEYAARHPERRITIKMQHGKESATGGIEQTFNAHPALLPKNVTIKILLSKCKILIRGTGVVDRDYHENARHMVWLAELAQHSPSTPVNAALSVDFYEFLTHRRLRAGAPAMGLLLDADNCLYNSNYRMMLLKLIYHHLDEIKDCALAAGEEGEKQGDLSDCLMEEITNTDFAIFTDDNANNWVDYINLNGDYTDEDLKKERPHDIDDRYVVVMRQYIRYLNRITPAIMTYILFRANEMVFDRIVQRALEEKCAGIVVKSFSARQSHHEDHANCCVTGTGLFMHDLHELVGYLNMHYRHKIGFVHDRFLMPDAYNNLAPGESHKRKLTRSDSHAYSVLDASKVAMLIVFAHYLKHRYPGLLFAKILDDRDDIFKGFLHLFNHNNQHVLLPKDLPLLLMTYDGSLEDDVELLTLTGSGELAANVHHLARLIAHHSGCDLSRIERHPIEHNIAKKLNVAALMARMAPAVVLPLEDEPPVRHVAGRLFRPVVLYHNPDAYGRPIANVDTKDTPSKMTHRFT